MASFLQYSSCNALQQCQRSNEINEFSRGQTTKPDQRTWSSVCATVLISYVYCTLWRWTIFIYQFGTVTMCCHSCTLCHTVVQIPFEKCKPLWAATLDHIIKTNGHSWILVWGRMCCFKKKKNWHSVNVYHSLLFDTNLESNIYVPHACFFLEKSPCLEC